MSVKLKGWRGNWMLVSTYDPGSEKMMIKNILREELPYYTKSFRPNERILVLIDLNGNR